MIKEVGACSDWPEKTTSLSPICEADTSLPPIAIDGHTGRRCRLAFGNKERTGERLCRHCAAFLEIGHPFASEERIVDQEVPGKTLGGLLEDCKSRAGPDARRPRH